MFYKPYSFNESNLIIKKKLTPNIYPIKNKNENQNDKTDNFIIQTPTMFIPFGLVKCKFSGKEYIYISFLNLNNYKDIEQFEIFIKNIEKCIKSKFKQSKFKSYKFKESLKKNDFYPPLLKLNFASKDILLFNEDNQKIFTTDIKEKIYGKFIIQLSHIWINTTTKLFGINFNICQIKLFVNMTFLPQTLEFIDDNDISENEKVFMYKHKYHKYFDMHKKGIPVNAIKQKLILDNLDPTIIDNPNKIIESSIIPAPPPPPLPLQFSNGFAKPDSKKFNLKNTNHSSNPMAALLGQLKNNNIKNLKKATKDQRKKTENTYISHSLLIPNKIDIINGKNKLRKNKNNITLI
jgi:hypothetical protein